MSTDWRRPQVVHATFPFVPIVAAFCLMAVPGAVRAESDSPVDVGSTGKRPDLAIAGFQTVADNDPRDAWMAVALEETFIRRLRRVPGCVVVPAVRLHQARDELKDSAEQNVTWNRVARLLGARALLTGTCGGPPEAVSLELEWIGLDPGEPSNANATTTLLTGRLFEVIDHATRWTLERVRAEPLSDDLKKVVFARPCKSPTALEYYSKAVAAARAAKGRDTAYYAREAVSFDPRFRPAVALLAQVEMRLSPESHAAALSRLRVLSELARREKDPYDRAEAETAQGLALVMEGNFEAAQKRFENALGLAYETEEPYGQIAAINGLCDLYLSKTPPPGVELPPEARTRFAEAARRRAAEWQEIILQLLRALNDTVAETPAANKLALIYDRLGDKERALILHKRTLDAAVRSGSARNQATAWMYLGQWYRREQQWPQALDATSRCLAFANPSAKPAARVALAGIYHAMGKPQDALAQYEVAYKEVGATDDLNNQYVCVREIASLRMQLEQREQALVALQEAIDIAHVLNLPEEAQLRERLAGWQAGGKP